MPAPGAKPKQDRSQVVHKNPTHEFVEVLDVPFADAPPLRPRATGGISVLDVGAANSSDWPDVTRGWWAAISTMPHCARWTPTDWQFAMDTAEIHARTMEAWKGYTGAELRQREKILGTTADARRDLRIKYVPHPVEPAAGDVPDNVTHLNAYRDL